MVFCCGISILSLLQKCIIPYHSFLDCWITMFKFLSSVWNLKRQYLPVKDLKSPGFKPERIHECPGGEEFQLPLLRSCTVPGVYQAQWGVRHTNWKAPSVFHGPLHMPADTPFWYWARFALRHMHIYIYPSFRDSAAPSALCTCD